MRAVQYRETHIKDYNESHFTSLCSVVLATLINLMFLFINVVCIYVAVTRGNQCGSRRFECFLKFRLVCWPSKIGCLFY